MQHLLERKYENDVSCQRMRLLGYIAGVCEWKYLKLSNIWTSLCQNVFIFSLVRVSAIYKSIKFLIKLEPKGKFNQEMKFKVNPFYIMTKFTLL
jgi:hypothetical protein